MESQREKQLLDKGIELFNKNSLKKSFELLEEVTNINSKNSDAYFYIGNIFHIQGQFL